MKNFLQYTFSKRVIAYLLLITFLAVCWLAIFILFQWKIMVVITTSLYVLFVCAIIIGNWLAWCDYRHIQINKDLDELYIPKPKKNGGN